MITRDTGRSLERGRFCVEMSQEREAGTADFFIRELLTFGKIGRTRPLTVPDVNRDLDRMFVGERSSQLDLLPVRVAVTMEAWK